MARFNDLMTLTNDTIRKNEIRKRVGEIVTTALIAEFGEEFTRYLVNDIYVGDASKIPNGTIISDVGDVVDKDKMTKGALVQIEIKVKQWNDIKTDKTDRQAVTLDDIDEAIQEAEIIAEEKRIKKEEKEKRKKEKIARDKKAREKKEG